MNELATVVCMCVGRRCPKMHKLVCMYEEWWTLCLSFTTAMHLIDTFAPLQWTCNRNNKNNRNVWVISGALGPSLSTPRLSLESKQSASWSRWSPLGKGPFPPFSLSVALYSHSESERRFFFFGCSEFGPSFSWLAPYPLFEPTTTFMG